jgi:hypothetical protein
MHYQAATRQHPSAWTQAGRMSMPWRDTRANQRQTEPLLPIVNPAVAVEVSPQPPKDVRRH